MTSNLDMDHAREAERSSRAIWERCKRVALSPVSVFRANRRASDDQLSVDGKSADWTVFDRARRDRHRRAVEAADGALNLARAEQAKPYSLAGEVVRRIAERIGNGAALLGGAGLAVAGAGFSIWAAVQASRPDAVLVEHAMRVHQAPRLPTATDERAFLLGVATVGVVLLIVGLHRVREWLRPAPEK